MKERYRVIKDGDLYFVVNQMGIRMSKGYSSEKEAFTALKLAVSVCKGEKVCDSKKCSNVLQRCREMKAEKEKALREKKFKEKQASKKKNQASGSKSKGRSVSGKTGLEGQRRKQLSKSIKNRRRGTVRKAKK